MQLPCIPSLSENRSNNSTKFDPDKTPKPRHMDLDPFDKMTHLTILIRLHNLNKRRD